MSFSQHTLFETAADRSRLLPVAAPTIWDESFAPEFYLEENPHFGDVVRPEQAPKVVSEPYVGDITAGKNTYVYDAHTYHTKVPPAGIRQLIEHFTDPGQVVLDPFCGSGMTGVAALEARRHVLLSDLSPAAAFIAFNHCTPIDHRRFMAAVREVLDQTRPLEEKLYSTSCRVCGDSAPLLYTVWSYGVVCPHCSSEFPLWDAARDEQPRVRDSKILSEFPCPHCGVHLKKRGLARTKRYPVQVGYSCCAGGLKEQTAEPNSADLQLLSALEAQGVPDNLWFPRNPFPEGVNTRQAVLADIDTVDKAYTPRALWAVSALWRTAACWPEPDIRAKLFFVITSLYQRVTVFSEFRFWGGSGNIANYNVPAIMNEQNVFRTFERKARTISWYFRDAPPRSTNLRVSVHSALSHAQLPDASVDYVFTDPPFGSNINYSEMNFLWESWLGVHTDSTEEAIVNRVQGKGVSEYETILADAFAEISRVLKPTGWLTVVFHNSSASVWNALQNAIARGGFEIRGTQTFDKKHGTFKQFVSENAVGYDLVLHCQRSGLQPAATLPNLPARDFICTALSERTDRYHTAFLHVRREAEFDYRRLYAEWLRDTIAGDNVALSFDAFRALVDEIRREETR